MTTSSSPSLATDPPPPSGLTNQPRQTSQSSTTTSSSKFSTGSGSGSTPWSLVSKASHNHHRGAPASPSLNGQGNGPVEPIAIIGMSCRLPGSATDVSSFWDMLVSGQSAWTPGPPHSHAGGGRSFNMDSFRARDREGGKKSGTTNAGGAHWLKEDVAAFDTAFFGISPVEAVAMDPQQRLLLELAYETFQNAGLSLESLSGSHTGVYVGQWSSDYHEMMTRDPDQPPLYLVTGTGPAISSNRISYCFNLRGPSFTVDTGCSSSFVALHSAIQSLRSGETTQCFVGGVNLLLDPQRFHYQSRLKMFSADGRSFAFDSRANGYGRGEGCTGVVIKSLSAALRDGDPIRAVIRSSVLNQDGKTQGITLPSAAAQREAILKAYSLAHLEPAADYVEAHGTGTRAGDPIEVGAIASVLSMGRRSSRRKLPIGSVKANIGHTEAAAGLAGLIKAVLMLENGVIPPQVNYEKGNPDILLDEWNLRIPLRAERQSLRRISVNCFGYGGTNAHIVLDAATDHLPCSSPITRHPSWSLSPPATTPRVFFLSGASQASTQRMCKRLAKYLISKQPTLTPDLLSRLSSTLAKQTKHVHRISLVASTPDSLITQLFLASTQIIPSFLPGRDGSSSPKLAFVFTGQGAQYPEMARSLLQTRPTFFRSLERARSHLTTNLRCEWDLISELCRPKAESRIHEPAYAQPLTTAVQIALVDLLAEIGVVPDVVVGHSSGEIAAAYGAGLMGFEDAMTASYFRGKGTSELLARDGGMLAVGASPIVVEDYIKEVGEGHGRMRIACFNSPSSVTVSGDAAAIQQLAEVLEGNGVFNRKLLTNGAAYHSHQMVPLAEKYAISLAGLKPTPAGLSSVRMVSSVTGEELEEHTILDGEYWVRNLLSPVRFSQAVKFMLEQQSDSGSIDAIVEIGPHSQLAGPIKQILKTLPKSLGNVAYTNALRRGSDAEETMLQCLGFLCIQGCAISTQRLSNDIQKELPSLCDLPPYPFDHTRKFWHETRISRDYRNRPHLPHELLGTLSPDVNRVEPRWRRFLSTKESPWLRKHVIQGQVVFPAAAFLTMAIQAALQQFIATSPNPEAGIIDAITLRNISIGKALVLPDEDSDSVEVSLSLRPQARTARGSSSVWNEFRVFSVAQSGECVEHCRGLVCVEVVKADDGAWREVGQDEIARISSRCINEEASTSSFYTRHRDGGLDWQSPFDNLCSIKPGPNSCLAIARCPEDKGIADPGGVGDILPAALLDSLLFHGLCFIAMSEAGTPFALVPTFIGELRMRAQPVNTSGELVVASERAPEQGPAYNVFVSDAGGALLQAEDIQLTRLPGDVSTAPMTREMCHSTEWIPYTESWTPQHRKQTCQSTTDLVSMVAQNRKLNALTVHHVQKVLGQTSLEDIPEGSYFRRLFEWMQTLASAEYDASLLSAEDDTNTGAVGEAISRLGPHFSDILRGKTDPLALLTPDNLLGRLYEDERCTRCYSQMAAWCGEVSRQKPGLRILEVGAGTGGTTAPLLGALMGRFSRYDFTDLSSGFFEGAKRRLGELADAAVEFKVLNIERHPDQQGFDEASYDLIIASNVLHATSCIDDTLNHVRWLLKPRGRLMLLEVTNPQPFYNMTFGAFEGWWAGYEEGRRLSPVLEPAEWEARLRKAGFAEAEAYFRDSPETHGGSLTVFVANAPLPPRKEALPPITLLTTETELPATVDGLEKMAAILSEYGSKLGQLTLTAQHLTIPSPGRNIVVILPEVAKFLTDKVDEDSWQGFKEWILNARAVLLVGEENSPEDAHPGVAGLWAGFARCLRLEHPEIRIITLQLEHSSLSVSDKLATILPVFLEGPAFDPEFSGEEVETEFADRNGQLFVPRLIHEPEASSHVLRSDSHQGTDTEIAPFLMNGRILKADLGVPGLLETLRWTDDIEAPPSLGPDDIKIELRAASINFKDVLIAAGQLEGITEMRNDCGGVVVEVGDNMRGRFQPGDRVCALYSRSYTNYPVVHGDCCQVIPHNMSFEEGASLPIVWATVYYSLVDLGRLKRGDKVLIHSAAGAVGQAAIMLAQHLGAEVFATASSAAKRELLRNNYGIPPDHIFSSRTTAFSGAIRRLTSGYGVDVVLNSLGGELFRESCNLMAHFGRFIEIGRRDLMDDALMPMRFLLKNVTFAYVDLAAIIDRNKPLAGRILRSVIELAAAGHIRAVPLTIMPISEIESAFRLVQTGKHTGKVILKVEDGQHVKTVSPSPTLAQLKPDAAYVVVGGFGGLGRAVVSWMATRGAKHIVALSRSGANDAHSRAFLQEMRAQGINVVGKACDVSSMDQLNALLEDLRLKDMPPIRGVVQSAMVLRDSLLHSMPASSWTTALLSKVQGTLNLQTLLDTKDSSLDFFTLLSSTVAICGNLGQSNYAAACSFQDSFAQHRVRRGRPGFSINVGPVTDVGFVSENPEVAEWLRDAGFGAIDVKELLAVVDYSVKVQQDGQRREDVAGCATGMARGRDLAGTAGNWMRVPLFGHVRLAKERDGTAAAAAIGAGDTDARKTENIGAVLASASTLEDAVGVVIGGILKQLSKLMAAPVEMLSSARSLDSYGVDSLVAVELRNWIGAYLGANVQLMVLQGTSSIDALATIVVKESRLVSFDTV